MSCRATPRALIALRLGYIYRMRTNCLPSVLVIAGASNAQFNNSSGSFENMPSSPDLPEDVYKCEM